MNEQNNNQAAGGFPVETSGLTKVYKSGRNNVTAILDFSLKVKKGEFLTIMGASGSGKSTLLHLLGGLTEPTGGSVIVDGVDIAKLTDAERTHFRCKNIGIVFQAFNLIPTLTAEENIMLPALIEGKPVSREKLEELLKTLDIKERRRHRPDALSGGEQQRTAIARALIMDPAIILADEPTGNLDSFNGERFCKALRQLCDSENRTIVLVTHEHTVASWGDRCITLKDGRIFGERIIDPSERPSETLNNGEVAA